MMGRLLAFIQSILSGWPLTIRSCVKHCGFNGERNRAGGADSGAGERDVHEVTTHLHTPTYTGVIWDEHFETSERGALRACGVQGDFPGQCRGFPARDSFSLGPECLVLELHPRFADEDFRTLQEVQVLFVLYFPGSRRNYRGMKGKYWLVDKQGVRAL